MSQNTGVYQATKKDGTLYYRASVTYRTKHISLGSFDTENLAHQAYTEAKKLLNSGKTFLPDDYQAQKSFPLSFQKWISLINFKNNGLYIKTPIYMQSQFFNYYLTPEDVLTFDADDLFYYSNHAIIRRGNHLFVSEYGMQTNIRSRYGIKNFARLGVDFIFVNGDKNDFRYSNIKVLNPYHGVTEEKKKALSVYTAKIHIRGNIIIGRYDTPIKAAIAYNKAVDICEKKTGKHFEKNFIETLNAKEYKKIYQQIEVSPKILAFKP